VRTLLGAASALALLWIDVQTVGAASLRVSPTSIDMVEPNRAAILRLRNEAAHPIHAQIRLFRWSQRDGVERLEPTTDVVASPPTTKLDPGIEYVVRVIHASKKPIRPEESFRILVDEIPVRSSRRPGTVNLVIRHSISIFVRKADAQPPRVEWSAGLSRGSLVLTVRNSGDARLRIHDLQLSQAGRRIAGRTGLLGYVLGGSVMTFELDIAGKIGSSPIRIQSRSDSGAIDAFASIQGR
jgi:fimbrial chaperone protein